MAIAKNPKVVMTSDEFVARLKTLAGRKTYYKNKFPDNMCFVHSDGRTSADCVCLIKAVLNGYDVNNNSAGYYLKPPYNITGDCTETELLCQCSDITDDFSNMGNKARILWMNKPNGHVGVYLGHEVTINGKVYNVIECSSGWKGITYSYVDADGTRRKYRGSAKNCKWMKNGLPDKWVSYNTQNDENSSKKPKANISTYPILKKGSKGDYVKKLKLELLKKGYYPVNDTFDDATLAAVKKYQSENTDTDGKKLVVDGYVGPKTWGSLES